MISSYNSLDIGPENGEFFLPHQFDSTLKDKVLTDEEYENIKKILPDHEIGEFRRAQQDL